VKRWFIIVVLLLGMGSQAAAGENKRPIMLGLLAQFAIGLVPPFSISVPLHPEITGDVHALKVLRKHRISKLKSAYEMRCLPFGSCAFPFFVIVEKPEIEELPPDYVLNKGDVVVLRLIRKGYSARLVTVCLESGSINDQIKVKTVDGKQKFSAKVIDHELVVSERSDRQ
jgi:hypothetical protein